MRAWLGSGKKTRYCRSLITNFLPQPPCMRAALFKNRPSSSSKILCWDWKTSFTTLTCRGKAHHTRNGEFTLNKSRVDLHDTGRQDIRNTSSTTKATNAVLNSANERQSINYSPPQKGLLSYLPRSVLPYAELTRIDKPAGFLYLFFPCAFSTLLAAPHVYPSVGPLEVSSLIGLFFTGAVIMRGAGCTINDLWDRNLDPLVARTRHRPIARRAINPKPAVIFTGAQLLAGLTVLVQFPTHCLFYGVPSLLLVTTYPLAKRVTNYPQAVLGLAFSWGAIMGFPAVGIDLLSNSALFESAGLLYLSCVSWTILYDMIYAHMDIKDDAKAGIKSIALKHEKNTKAVLSSLAVVQVALLAAAGQISGAGPPFFIGTCGSAAVSLGLMIWRVQLKNTQNCWWWFRNGCIFTGGGITFGLCGNYFAAILQVENDGEK